MPRGNPKISQARRGRKKKEDRLYIHVNSEYGVTVDTYNIILVHRVPNKKQGTMLDFNVSYVNTFPYMAEVMKQHEVPQADIDVYLQRVAGFSTTHKDGKLVVKIPKGFVSDVRPVSANTKEENE